MRQSIQDREKIKLYMEIAAWSPKSALFYPKDSERSFEVELSSGAGSSYVVRFNRSVTSIEGSLVLRVYTLQFRINVILRPAREPNVYHFEQPRILLIHDPRRAIRVSLAPHITKMVVVKKLAGVDDQDRKPIQAIILDISANGIAFRIPKPDRDFAEGRMMQITYSYQDLHISGNSRVVGVAGDVVRCFLVDIDKKLQRDLNLKIAANLDYMIRKHHRELQTLRDAGSHLKALSARRKRTSKFQDPKQLERHLGEIINPCYEAALSVLDSFLDLKIIKRDISLERISRAIYDISAELSFNGERLNGNMFLCLKEETAQKMICRTGSGEDSRSETEQMGDLVGELSNMILGNAKRNLARQIRIGTPTVIIGKEHMVAVLSQLPVVRMVFDSELGRIDLLLFLNEIRQDLEESVDVAATRFEYREELINPILTATENLFIHFLALDVRKKGVVLRESLAPRFELSAMLDIFSTGVRGKILLNVSEKLALKIHEILLMGEQKVQIDDEVKDAMGEMLNIIAGNAKAEFKKMDLGYQINTPFVVQGRNHIIRNAGHDPFLTSIYWTNEGFFEVCLCFMEIKTPARAVPAD